jgi:hypothetical protein
MVDSQPKAMNLSSTLIYFQTRLGLLRLHTSPNGKAMCYSEHNCITALRTTNNGEEGPYFDVTL